ncbi:MAG TPA: biotin/lipoyl-binding protein [Vicinamibacterales bacterium]
MCLAASVIVASAALAQQQMPSAQEEAPPTVHAAAAPPAGTAAVPVPTPRELRHELLSIAAPSNGSVEVVYVRVGDHVDAGQALLTFSDHQAANAVSRLRLEIASDRARAAELEGSVRTLDAAITAATEALPPAAAQETPPEAAAVVARAEAVYNEAVARERRAAALQAHGIAATQELEAAQMAVRGAAEDLALARREAEAKTALAAAQVVETRTQGERAIAAQRTEHDRLAAEIGAVREQQRAAEAALLAATADSLRLVVRAPADATVTGLVVQPGDRALAGARLLELDRIPSPDSRIPVQ